MHLTQRRFLKRAAVLAIFSLTLAGLITATAPAASALTGFVTRSGNQLRLNSAEFRFAGTNAQIATPQNGVTSDHVYTQNYATHFEVDNVLTSAQDMGMNVVRAYSLGHSVGCPHCLEQSPGTLNQRTFDVWDYAMKAAGDRNIRLIIPLVEGLNCDRGDQTGSKETWAAWNSATGCTGFFTDPTTVAKFKQYVSTVLNHVNSLTGIAYKEDPVVLAWETSNEGHGSDSWSSDITSYIKSIDQNHLVAWGENNVGTGPSSTVLADPNIDMYSTHEYSGAFSNTTASQVASANKVFFVGEYPWNYLTTTQLSLIENQHEFAGDLTWELIGLTDSYGFHPDKSHPATGDDVTQYYPASDSTYRTYMNNYRNHAFAMRGISVPAHLALATAPVITGASATNVLTWRGSPSAYQYSVERSTTSATSGFSIICNKCATDWSTPWQDSTAPAGRKWYRVRGYNLDSVASSYSNVWDTGASNPVTTYVNDATTTGTHYWTWGSGWATGTSTSDYSSGNYHRSSAAGSTATLNFTGSQVALMGGTNDHSGTISISLDGNSPVTVDLYSYSWQTYSWDSPDGERGNSVVYVSPAVASGAHTLVVTSSGTRNAASTGSEVTIDGAEVNPRGLEAGAATAPSLGSTTTTVEDTVTGTGSNQWNYSGSWTAASGQSGYSAGTEHYSNSTNNTATISFTGTNIQLYAGKNNSNGKVGCKIDSGTEVIADAYQNVADLGNQLLCDSGPLSAGSHTLTVRVTGTKNSASADYYVAVDRAVITTGSAPISTTVEDTVTGTGSNQWNYSGSWTAASGQSGYSAGTEHYSNSTNNTATISFTGTNIQLYAGKNNSNGKVGCKIDSGTEVIADAYQNVADLGNQLLCDSGPLSAGSHTLTVRVTGTKNSASADYYVAVDRAVITN